MSGVDVAALTAPERLGPAPANWLPAVEGLARDVVVIGAGQSGIAIAFALRRAGISNIEVVDGAAGHPGVWRTRAYMERLRQRGVRHAMGRIAHTFEGLVDWHAHFFPSELVEQLSARAHAPRIVTAGAETLLVGADGDQHRLGQDAFDITRRERELDEAGIAHQVLSLPGLMGIDTVAAEDAPALVRSFNEGISRLVEQRPGRFSALALVPLAQLDAAPAVLADALDRLGLTGVILPTAAFRDEETAGLFSPVLAELDARGGHLFVHPGPLPGVAGTPVAQDSAARIRKSVLGIRNDLSAAAVTLEVTPLLDAFPRISVHVANLAGTLPFLAERIAHGAARYGVGPADAAGRQRRIRVDTASLGQRAIALAAQVFGPERILFGTDAPIFAVSEALHALADSGVVPVARPAPPAAA